MSTVKYEYWRDGFRLAGCEGLLVAEGTPALERTYLETPAETTTFYQDFALRSGAGFSLPYRAPVSKFATPQKALEKSPSPYRIVYLAEAPADWHLRPFFYQDRHRTFVVSRKTETVEERRKWPTGIGIDLDAPFHGAVRWAEMLGDDVRARIPETNASETPIVRFDEPARWGPGDGPAGLLGETAARYALTTTLPRTDPARAARSEITYIDERGSVISRVRAGDDAENVVSTSRVVVVDFPHIELPPGRFIALKPPVTVDRYLFKPFYHPYVCTLIKQVNRYGVEGLLDPPLTEPDPGLRRQALSDDFFFTDYGPTELVAKPYPVDDFDFERHGAYAPYNWELFFHAPMLIAQRLVTDQRFEEALRWFHAVFHPMEHADPSEEFPRRVWKIRPFFHAKGATAVEDLLATLGYIGSDPAKLAAKDAVEEQIADWRARPFEPHLLARLRPNAYQRYVVMKYVEALIAWGDQLFRRDTLESLNEAAQLYVMAHRILGRRPERVEQPQRKPKTFNELAKSLDAFSNALAGAESLVPASDWKPTGGAGDTPAVTGPSFYFCIPPNEKLLGYWDTVEDRLFKLRHCMNIEGIVRQLPLFEPPIDPALLVRATAAGLDRSTVLDDLAAPPPVRRFRVLLQKAHELANEVRSLGASLLASLEERDAEQLSQLRARHERDLLDAMRTVRTKQIDEARETLGALERSREAVDERYRYYSSRERTIADEDDQQAHLERASVLQISAQGLSAIAGVVAGIPQFEAGFVGPAPRGGTSFGGRHLYSILQGAASAVGAFGTYFQLMSAKSGNSAMWTRRADDWALQAELAKTEIAQIDKQLLAQQIRIAIVEQELRVHDRQQEHAREVEDHLRDKYTSRELYDWMVTQLSSIYFQSYKLLFDVARRAERAYQRERFDPARSFIKFGAWQSLRKGLLAGERLSLDLRRMEQAYLEEDRREYELIKHVSLAELDPHALIKLRTTGRCQITLPESVFDIDTPGHYLRRIRTLSVTIPSVTGPYVAVRCTVTLLSSRIRTEPRVEAKLQRSDVSVQAMVTSHAREDSGLFEADPRSDDRYLPFEGAGVIADLRLELPNELRAFDYDTIADVIVHLRYTAREGGADFRAQVTSALKESLAKATPTGPLAAFFSVRAAAADAWRRLLDPPESSTSLTVDVPLTADRLPFAVNRDARIVGVDLIGVVSDPTAYAASEPLRVAVAAPSSAKTIAVSLASDPALAGHPRGRATFSPDAPPGAMRLTITQAALDALSERLVVGEAGRPKRLAREFWKDLLVIVHYRLTKS